MTHPSCVLHAKDIEYMKVHADVIFIGEKNRPEQAHAFACSLRVLETRKNDLMAYLSKKGLPLSEENLWFDVTWGNFERRSLDFFGERTYREVFPYVVGAGFARQRYIKRDTSGQNVLDEQGRIVAYDCYKVAQSDTTWRGDIIHQAWFDSDYLNEWIAFYYAGGPEPTPPATKKRGVAQPTQGDNLHNREHTPEKDVVSEREGYSRDAQSFSVESISLGGTFANGVGGNITPLRDGKSADTPGKKRRPPVGKSANNKNLIKEESKDREQLLISADRAIDIDFSTFDFAQKFSTQAILELDSKILPPLPTIYRVAAHNETQPQLRLAAAERFATHPELALLGLRQTARFLAYMSQPDSPGGYVVWMRENRPGIPHRLWLITDRVIERGLREMLASDWWPAWLPPDDVPTTSAAPAALDIEILDLAELAGIAHDDRRGFSREDVDAWRDYLCQELKGHGYFVDVAGIGQRHERKGYRLEVSYEGGQLRIYDPEHWDLIMEADRAGAPGTPAFAEALVALLRDRAA